MSLLKDFWGTLKSLDRRKILPEAPSPPSPSPPSPPSLIIVPKRKTAAAIFAETELAAEPTPVLNAFPRLPSLAAMRPASSSSLDRLVDLIWKEFRQVLLPIFYQVGGTEERRVRLYQIWRSPFNAAAFGAFLSKHNLSQQDVSLAFDRLVRVLLVCDPTRLESSIGGPIYLERNYKLKNEVKYRTPRSEVVDSDDEEPAIPVAKRPRLITGRPEFTEDRTSEAEFPANNKPDFTEYRTAKAEFPDTDIEKPSSPAIRIPNQMVFGPKFDYFPLPSYTALPVLLGEDRTMRNTKANKKENASRKREETGLLPLQAGLFNDSSDSGPEPNKGTIRVLDNISNAATQGSSPERNKSPGQLSQEIAAKSEKRRRKKANRAMKAEEMLEVSKLSRNARRRRKLQFKLAGAQEVLSKGLGQSAALEGSKDKPIIIPSSPPRVIDLVGPAESAIPIANNLVDAATTSKVNLWLEQHAEAPPVLHKNDQKGFPVKGKQNTSVPEKLNDVQITGLVRFKLLACIPKAQPVSLPYPVQFTILTETQYVLERVCHGFAKAWAPELTKRFLYPESTELNIWMRMIEHECRRIPTAAFDIDFLRRSDARASLKEFLGKLGSTLVLLRHKTVHRENLDRLRMDVFLLAAVQVSELFKNKAQATYLQSIRNKANALAEELEPQLRKIWDSLETDLKKMYRPETRLEGDDIKVALKAGVEKVRLVLETIKVDLNDLRSARDAKDRGRTSSKEEDTKDDVSMDISDGPECDMA